MGWRSLVDWASESDDRIERFFLELKSDVDLTTKHGKHKVAKFILGSAHRDPVRAAKRFAGHAIMLLGVSRDSIVGIAPFEAKDLAREVAKFTGADGPIWDFELIPIDQAHDVVAIVVDPPSGQIWPCLADGQELVDGDVYIRGDGETSKAKGAELRAIVLRSGGASALPSVEVEVVGSATAVRLDDAALLVWIEDRAEDLRYQGRPKQETGGIQILSAISFDRRSRPEFLKQVDDWHSAATADPRDGIRDLVAAMAPPVRLRIHNETKQFLRDVRVDIEFDGEVEALEWLDREEAVPFPQAPKDFGTGSMADLIVGQHWQARIPSDGDREVIIREHSPARVSVSMRVLRPEEEFVTDENEFVIACFVPTPDPIQVTGRWRLTAGDINDVSTGEFTVTTELRDWVDPIATLLNLESRSAPPPIRH